MMIMTEKMMLMVMNVHLPAQDKLFIQPCESLKLVVLDMIFLILTSKILPSSSDDHSALLALRLLQGEQLVGIQSSPAFLRTLGELGSVRGSNLFSIRGF